MQAALSDFKPFERGIVILSIDTEQIWGYLDLFDEYQFNQRYPDTLGAHRKLLAALTTAGVGATWFLVGGMSLDGSEGPPDSRTAGLPLEWRIKIPRGVEATKPLWYRRSFVEHLRKVHPRQEIGLHGGLSHFIWTHPQATREVVEWELAEGVKALNQALVHPLSFSYGREQEAHHVLLLDHGIRCYRGRTVARAYQLGPTLPGAVLRMLDELRRATPSPVWPQETLPGLWNIPASLFLYPIGAARTKVVGLRSRVERFRRGVDAAIRHRGIFHFCLHPENLAESPQGFPMFEDLLEVLILSRSRGDIEILTMSEVAARMEQQCERKVSDQLTSASSGTLTGVRC
jgi:hypothetical protein